jgi:hypothetical protein
MAMSKLEAAQKLIAKRIEPLDREREQVVRAAARLTQIDDAAAPGDRLRLRRSDRSSARLDRHRRQTGAEPS